MPGESKFQSPRTLPSVASFFGFDIASEENVARLVWRDHGVVKTRTHSPGTGLGNIERLPGEKVRFLDFAVAEDGWTTLVTTSKRGIEVFDRPPGGMFGPSQLLTAKPSGFADVEVSEEGGAVVTKPADESRGVERSAVRLPGETSFGPWIPVPGSGKRHFVGDQAMAANGTVTTLLSRGFAYFRKAHGFHIKVTELPPGGEFSPPVGISHGNASDALLLADDSGRMLAVWQLSNGARITDPAYARRKLNGDWTDPVVLATSHGAWLSAGSMTREGAIVLAAQRFDEGPDDMVAWYARPGHRLARQPEAVAPDVARGQFVEPHTAIDESGKALYIWSTGQFGDDARVFVANRRR